MPYLNLDPGYFTNIKTIRLVSKLGTGAEILPLKLWAHCAAHHPEDGSLNGYSEDEIESIVGWTGQCGQAVQAMLEVGFLQCSSDAQALSVYGWRERQGHIWAAHKRAKTAAEKRWGQFAKSDDAKEDGKQCSSDSQALLNGGDASLPFPSVRSVPSVPSLQTTPTPGGLDSVLDALKSVGLGSAAYLATEFPAVRPWQIREIMAEAPVGANIGLKVSHFRHRMAAEIKKAERKPPPPPTFNRTGKPFAELAEENPELAAKIPKPKKDASDA